MDIMLLISLVVAAGAAVYGFFLDRTEPWKRIIFVTLTLLGIGFAFFIANRDSKQVTKIDTNVDSLLISSAKVGNLLIDANDQLSDQSDKLSEGFKTINDQLASLDGGNSTIVNQMRNLQTQVNNFVKTSFDFNKQALEILTQQNKVNGEEATAHSTTKVIKIPLGDNNARHIDSKHFFSVASDKPDENNKITILFNRSSATVAPGRRVTSFRNDMGKYTYLEYLGVEDNKYYVFNVHE